MDGLFVKVCFCDQWGITVQYLTIELASPKYCTKYLQRTKNPKNWKREVAHGPFLSHKTGPKSSKALRSNDSGCRGGGRSKNMKYEVLQSFSSLLPKISQISNAQVIQVSFQMHSDVTHSGISNDIYCAAWNQMQNNKVPPEIWGLLVPQSDQGRSNLVQHSAAVPPGAILRYGILLIVIVSQILVHVQPRGRWCCRRKRKLGQANCNSIGSSRTLNFLLEGI